MPDYWQSCGYRLLRTTRGNSLSITDDFLRSYLLRPELAPVPESCAAELALHERLLNEPRIGVVEADIAAMRDAGARDNYRIWLRFRERLLAATTLESAYVELFRGDGVDVPPQFVAQLTQILLRHILGDSALPFEARAAEMLFRPQKISMPGDGAVMAADEQTVQLYATSGGFSSLGELLAQNRIPARTIELDVLSQDNAASYWERDERFDFAVTLNRGAHALEALCRVLERWIVHFFGITVTIKPQREIDDQHWVWHVGLDAEASALLNDLYNRAEIAEERMQRLLCLFELRFASATDVRAAVAGRPVYLAMAMDQEQRLKLKPQNLLCNLPLARD